MKIRVVVLLIFSVLLLFLGISWLLIGLVLILLLYRLKQILVFTISRSYLKKIIVRFYTFFIIIVSIIGIRVFIVDVYIVPSSSMENTLYPNDVILVNKLIYGPKLFKNISELPWVNLFYNKKKHSSKERNQQLFKETRLGGIGNVNNEDVVVFKTSENGGFIVKRCVSIAGDTLQIINGKVYNNHIENESSPHVLNKYECKVDDFGLFDQQLDSLKLDLNITYAREFYEDWVETTCTNEQSKMIKHLSSVDSIHIKPNKKPIKVNRFAWYKDKNWTLDNYGAIVVPKKGMKIEFTEENLMFYKYIIRKHEKIRLKQKKGKVYLDGKESTCYVFKYDYYFMMGDNRHNSTDSRFFGMIPKEKIVGKVQCVLFSNKENKFQWTRLFKGV